MRLENNILELRKRGSWRLVQEYIKAGAAE